MGLKKICNTLSSALISFVLILAVMTIGVRAVGIDVFVVLSGSMEPAIHTGSLVYVKEKEDLKVGDIITYQISDSMSATHRIIEVIEEESGVSFKTKGDANDHEDPSLVREDDVIGSAIFSIPFLGYLMNYVQSTSGKFALIAYGALSFLLLLISGMLSDEKKEDSEEKLK